MPTERVLVEVITTANMAGVEQAQAGMLKMSETSLLLAATLGVAIVVGKAGIENLKKQEEAANLLTQAYATQKDTLAAHREEIDRFLKTNAAFISDQYDTEAALATLIRAGNDETSAMRMLNDALDWSAIKHVEVSVSATTLIKVLAGNQKALRELGITTDQYHEIMKSTLTTEQKRAAILDLIEAKTAKGRETIDATAQSQNKLTIAWQDFTAKTGPSLLVMWQKLNEAAATGLDILNLTVQALDIIAKHGPFGSMSAPQSGPSAAQQAHNRNRATGGPVVAGEAYTVGEQGPETLVMGDQGGSIIPNGGARSEIHIHIDRGAYIDGPSIDMLANAVALRLGYATGR